MKLFSWNVNGIRAAQKNGFLKWLSKADADVVCLQEIKAFEDQLDPEIREPAGGYRSFWKSAEKPGYSGVAILTRVEPRDVRMQGWGKPEFDSEGRILEMDFKDFTLINAYFPNSQREHERLPYKLAFCDAMLKRCEALRKKGRGVVVCGDFNIAHRPIDLKNPKANEKNAGYLPEERAWLDRYTDAGYVDTFRAVHGDVKDQYSWWSYRPGVREKNIGWRLDYFFTNSESKDRLRAARIHPNVKGSDHCPVELEWKA